MQIGQMLFYLTAYLIKNLTLCPYPKPTMGLFMADGHVSIIYMCISLGSRPTVFLCVIVDVLHMCGINYAWVI